MRNMLSDGEILTVTAPAAVSSGDLVIVGSIIGVAITDAADGAEVAIATCGVFSLTKEAPLVIAQGDTVYWDVSNANVDKTDTNTLLGVCTVSAVSAATTVAVKLLATA
jgi:predicted RecA/RadA family phage recombinase